MFSAHPQRPGRSMEASWFTPKLVSNVVGHSTANVRLVMNHWSSLQRDASEISAIGKDIRLRRKQRNQYGRNSNPSMKPLGSERVIQSPQISQHEIIKNVKIALHNIKR